MLNASQLRARRWHAAVVKQIEEENRKLKQLVADLSLDKHTQISSTALSCLADALGQVDNL